MSTVSALTLTRFRKTSKRAAAWMINQRYETLFLDLPEDLTTFVREYVDEEMPQEELWRNYGYLTGLQEPFINALRYRMDPILDVLPRLRYKMPELEVYCYQDLEFHP